LISVKTKKQRLKQQQHGAENMTPNTSADCTIGKQASACRIIIDLNLTLTVRIIGEKRG
jgi:hypothetical protein